jgi:RNA polymerase sigma factor (sigma-70 family)
MEQEEAFLDGTAAPQENDTVGFDFAVDTDSWYRDIVRQFPYLTKEGEEKLFASYVKTRDPKVRDAILQPYLRLVLPHARNYSRNGIPLADLVQEGNLALMTALEKFNPTWGVVFATYALPWITSNIRRYAMNNRNIIRVSDRKWKSNQKAKKVAKRLGVSIESQEVSEAVGISVEKIKKDLASAAFDFVSARDDIRTDDSQDRGHVLVSGLTLDPAFLFMAKQELHKLSETLKRLYVEVHTSTSPEAKRALEIFTAYIDRETPQGAPSLKQTGKKYGISLERVRQILLQTTRKVTLDGIPLSPKMVWEIRERISVLENVTGITAPFSKSLQ